MGGVRVFASVIAIALLAGIVAVSAGAKVGRTAKLPSQLVGSWTHFFTAAYWSRAGITDEHAEHLSLYVPADGNVALGEIYIRFTPLSGNRLAISGRFPDCSKTKSLYRWKVANRRLTLTKLQDNCNESAATFDGVVWSREGT